MNRNVHTQKNFVSSSINNETEDNQLVFEPRKNILGKENSLGKGVKSRSPAEVPSEVGATTAQAPSSRAAQLVENEILSLQEDTAAGGFRIRATVETTWSTAN
ncbi:hypothetical protein FRC12_004655 [Ceratobasidium sp. 428]|nr:hypothetical protein FRC12_004655 [Ceratobasidium sp. 428]